MVIVVSLVAAAIQMGLLLLTARVIGVAQYSQFSLIVSVAVFLSAFAADWLRMIVARHGGSRRLRFRAAILSDARAISLGIAFVLLAIAGAVAGMLVLLASAHAATFAAAIGIAGAGMALADMAATYLRYASREQWRYNVFMIVRVSLMGGAPLAAALAGAGGAQVGMAFGLSGIACGGSFVLLLWPGGLALNGRLLLRLAGQGWSLATGSIGTNIAMTLARVTLGIAMPGRASGGALLAIDLFSRGANVLGIALCNWGNRALLEAAHRRGNAGAIAAFGRFSAIFMAAWFSCALIGLVMCLAIPVFTLHLDNVGAYVTVALPTCVAIAVLYMRIFLFDCLLASLNRHREIALIASLTTVVALVGVAVAWAIRMPVLGASLFPIAVGLVSAVYVWRNWAIFRAATDRDALRFVIIKTAAVAVGGQLVLWRPQPGLVVGVVALLLIVDAVHVLGLVRRIRRPDQSLPTAGREPAPWGAA